jgi:hypothetical protein
MIHLHEEPTFAVKTSPTLTIGRIGRAIESMVQCGSVIYIASRDIKEITFFTNAAQGNLFFKFLIRLKVSEFFSLDLL